MCKQFLWGVRKKQGIWGLILFGKYNFLFLLKIPRKGFQCKFCMMAVHTKCIENVMTKCMKSAQQSRSPSTMGPSSIKVNIPHKWRAKTFAWPTMCTHCGQLIKGIFKQGLQCKDCKITAHKKCKDLIGRFNFFIIFDKMYFTANTCGTNMLKLNEMMASFDNINLPAPREITHDGDVQV